MKKITSFLMVLTIALLFSSCADSVHVKACLPQETPYGFWSGTWHGMTMTISFIGSLFNDNISIYAVNNNGAWYDFGYIGGFWFFVRFILGFINSLFNLVK
jgi:hypothetical protein